MKYEPISLSELKRRVANLRHAETLTLPSLLCLHDVAHVSLHEVMDELAARTSALHFELEKLSSDTAHGKLFISVMHSGLTFWRESGALAA